MFKKKLGDYISPILNYLFVLQMLKGQNFPEALPP